MPPAHKSRGAPAYAQVGFVVGMDGVLPLWRSLLADPGFMAGTLCTLFAAVQLMRALREREQRSLRKTDTGSIAKATSMSNA